MIEVIDYKWVQLMQGPCRGWRNRLSLLSDSFQKSHEIECGKNLARVRKQTLVFCSYDNGTQERMPLVFLSADLKHHVAKSSSWQEKSRQAARKVFERSPGVGFTGSWDPEFQPGEGEVSGGVHVEAALGGCLSAEALTH